MVEYFEMIPFRENFDTFCVDFKNSNNKPTFDVYSLSDDLHDWMIENNIIYRLYFSYGPKGLKYPHQNNWYVVFDNKKDAMLFKLTWR